MPLVRKWKNGPQGSAHCFVTIPIDFRHPSAGWGLTPAAMSPLKGEGAVLAVEGSRFMPCQLPFQGSLLRPFYHRFRRSEVKIGKLRRKLAALIHCSLLLIASPKSTLRVKSEEVISKIDKPLSKLVDFWSCYPDLNWRPHPYQGVERLRLSKERSTV